MQIVRHGLAVKAMIFAILSCLSAIHVSPVDAQADDAKDLRWVSFKKKHVAKKDASALPSASEIIDKHVMAMGGYELLGSLQSSHFVFKGKSSNGSELESVYYQTRGQYYCHLNRNGLSITRGVWSNGKLNEKGHRVGFAWQSVDGRSWTEKSGDELQEYLRRRTRVVAAPFWEEDFKSIECVGQTEVRGIPAWQLRFVDQDGKEITKYFEIETGYLLRRVTMESFDGQSHEVTREYKGHEKKGDFVVAMRQSIEYDNVVEAWNVDSFEYDVEVPEELLDVPPSIQKRIDAIELQQDE